MHQKITANAIGLWLRNILMAATILILFAGSYLLYRVSMVVYRVEKTVTGVSEDLRKFTGTVAELSNDVSKLRGDLVNLKNKAREFIEMDETRNAIDEALAVGAAISADQSSLPPAAEKEIDSLLSALLKSQCKAESGGKEQSLLALYGTIYGRYRLQKKALKSAEEFIDQIATQSVIGSRYVLIDAAGARTPLADWMKNQLHAIRNPPPLPPR